MKASPIPYRGRLLLERQGPGLRASLGSYPSGRQSLHVHARPSLSMLVAGRGVVRSRDQAHDQPPLTVIFHPTTAPHANDVGPGNSGPAVAGAGFTSWTGRPTASPLPATR
jgi:hypothetical protein